MNPELLALLRCPTCRGRLEPAPEGDSALRCTGGCASFPIAGGVPRLAGEAYVASFGRQWNRFDVARDQEDEAVFLAKTGVHPRDLAGQLVLDAGCGGGRYARLLGRFGAKVIGVDLSDAVDKAAALTARFPDVAIVQADLLDLPIAEGAFDLVFSIGVLHHSPDPRLAFAEIARRVRPGGRLAVWLYRRNTPPQEWLNTALRAATTRMPPRLLESISVGLGVLGGVPVVNTTLNKVFNFSNHPDWTLRVCDNFDWYAPRYQSHHTLPELRRWFEEEGFEDLVDLRPLKAGRLYDRAYDLDLIIGSGVNVAGTRRREQPAPAEPALTTR
ncbi:methyltransferase domain-containing protein [Tautonia sociabilis]|uniref:Methyltransferase domain-containing protein n=1 Tax=Tautonia sociabilis TaxID=2080755 RepID=A0A432MNM9_9BACT|nr:methyltransferase domain-containing protein [Tautonia sociabilis]RUL88678.1 methyltransferase domain-containing protein [Tautonia sociabilis]